jgi:hypothetical protein
MLLQRKIENILAARIRVLRVLLLSLALISMGLNLFLGPPNYKAFAGNLKGPFFVRLIIGFPDWAIRALGILTLVPTSRSLDGRPEVPAIDWTGAFDQAAPYEDHEVRKILGSNRKTGVSSSHDPPHRERDFPSDLDPQRSRFQRRRL